MTDSALDRVPMPARIAALPRDDRGFPVPWFVQWDGDKPLFPVMDGTKWKRAIKNKLCWVCGGPMGRMLHFVIGPMCCINRTIAEPPVHQDCAQYSLQVCPFLSNPRMRRVPTEKYTDGPVDVAGEMETRNPGISVDWTCRDYEIFKDPRGLPLIQLGEPIGVEWWREGRRATQEEIDFALEDGVALLRQRALELDGPESLPHLERLAERARRTVAQFAVAA